MQLKTAALKVTKVDDMYVLLQLLVMVNWTKFGNSLTTSLVTDKGH